MQFTNKTKSICMNLIITTFFNIMTWIWSITGLIGFTNGTSIISVLYLSALYISICRINQQKIGAKGFVAAVICGGVQYIGDNIITRIILERYSILKRYDNVDMFDPVAEYRNIYEAMIWENFLRELIQIAVLVVFMLWCCIIYKKRMQSIEKKYVVSFCIILASYIVIAVLIGVNSNNTFSVELRNPIAALSTFFYYAESLILWLAMNQLFVDNTM